MRMAKTRKPQRLVKAAKKRAQYEALRRLRSFLDAGNPKLARILVQMWDDQQTAITYKELRSAILRGSLTSDQFQAWQQDYAVFFNKHLSGILRDAAYAGGKDLAAAIRRGEQIYAPMLQGVENWVTTHGGEWITHMSQEQHKAVSTLIQYAANGNTTVDDLSRLIRPLIGLTEQQGLANLHFYENLCDSLKKDLLGKYPDMKETAAEIRAAAMAKESALRYASRQHRQRAMTIAQTELAFAYNKGADTAIQSAVSEGLLPPQKAIWCTAHDEDVCSFCHALDGQAVNVGEEFPIPGKSLYSGQKMTPPIHPSCHCALIYEDADDEYAVATALGPDYREHEDAYSVGSYRTETSDVTSEYFEEAKPGNGEIKFDIGFSKDGQPNEVRNGKMLHDTFGGDVTHLVVSKTQGQKMPDYVWRGKLWELKNPESEGNIDTLIRKGGKQIFSNPGGIIIDYGNMEFDIGKARKDIYNRARRINVPSFDVMIVQKGKVLEVLRFSRKKK